MKSGPMKPSTLTARDQTRDLRRRLTARFGRASDAVHMPEHAVLFEVPVEGVRRWETEEVDLRCQRRIDAVAVGLWQRTEHLVHGFEIKATRADLLTELKDPDKSEPARRLCDRWWLVLAHKELIKVGELPEGWGLLCASGRGLRVLVQPAPLISQRTPRFVASLVQTALRSHGTCAGLARVDGHLSGYRRGLEEGKRLAIRAENLRQLREAAADAGVA